MDLVKCSLILNLFLLEIHCVQIKNYFDNSDNDEFLLSLINKVNQLNLTNQNELQMYSDIYSNISAQNLIYHIVNLYRCDHVAYKSFFKLNAYANNVYNGVDVLKNNSLLKNSLMIILKNPSFNMQCRILAGKLSARLYSMPISIQTMGKNPNKISPNKDTYVIMPIVQRLYRADKYIEEYKSGNWEI